ncbi:MAG: cytidylate kinase-like family protein [Actinobacteria bacterium]|nr:MAG: cytidylate kinase-like family protein [Actinomycetota bacterium]
MQRTLICVAHCDGADGTEVARLVADQLGLRYVDEEIVTAAAQRAGAAPELVAEAEQRQPLLRRVLEELGASGAAAMVATGGIPPPVTAEPRSPRGDALRRFIADAIEAMAAEGNVVIGSHGASFVLGARDDLLRVFVTAPPAARARRVAQQRGIDEKEAERQIRDADKSRADYLKRSYDVDREDPTQYDLVVNTDFLSPGEAASLVAHAAGSG